MGNLQSSWRRATAVGALALVMAACSDGAKDPAEPTGRQPLFGLVNTGNGLGACMGDDAFAAGFINGMQSPSDLNCTSNDVDIAFANVTEYSFTGAPGSFVALPPGEKIQCTQNQTVHIVTQAILENNAQSRYDIGVWVATDGGDAVTGSCLHFNLVPGQNNSTNLEPSPFGDSCGDMAAGVVATVPLDTLQIQCNDPDGDTFVEVGACVGWLNSVGGDDRICPIEPPGGATGFRFGTTPETKAKCNCEPLVLPIDIRGKLRIKKTTVPAADPTAFTFTPTGWNSGATFTRTDAQAAFESEPLTAGTYSAVETVPAGWTLGPRSCVLTGTVTPKTFTAIANGVQVALAGGEDVTCTFTNTLNASSLDIEKVSVGAVGTFNYTVNGGGLSPFSRTTTTAGVATTTAPIALTGANATGDKYVTETVPAGWALTNISCTAGGATVLIGTGQGGAFNQGASAGFDAGDNTVKVTLANGNNPSCTFTNTRQSVLRIDKVTTPGGDPTSFTFTPTNFNSGNTFTLTDAATPFSSGFVAPGGTYSAVETVPAGWTLGTRSCVLTGTATPKTFTSIANGVQVVLNAGEDVTCSFPNTKQAVLRIDKITDPAASATSFTFTPTGFNSGNTFTLTDAATPFSSGFVTPGTYSAVETVPSGWSLAPRSCVLTGTATPKAFTSINNGVQVVLTAGQDVTCRFTNTELATIIIEKEVLGGGTQSFTFTRTKTSGSDLGDNPSPTLTNGQSSSSGKKLTPGEYTVCETNLPVGWQNPTAAGFTLVGDGLGNFCATFTVSAGQTRTIHFVNTPPPGGGTRTIGYWKNWSSCGKSGGRQYDKAIANGEPEATLDFYLGGAGIQSIYPIGDIVGGLTCEQAVALLNKTSFDGTKRANDPAYNLAAQFLAAKLNIAANAGSCTAANNALTAAQTLLAAIDFDGTGSYRNSMTSQQTSDANSLAAILDSYNNGTLLGGCPSHSS